MLGLGFWKEVTYGVIPDLSAGTGAIQLLRLVSDDLNTTLQREESNEIRADAQSSGSIITNASVGGSVQLQWSMKTYDDFIPGLLYSTSDAGTGRDNGWLAGGYVLPTALMATPQSVTFVFATNKFTFSPVLGRAPVAGEKILIRGFGNRNLDTVWEVSATTPGTAEFTPVNDTGAATVAAYAGVTADVTVTTGFAAQVVGYARNGTLERSFGLLKTFTDISAAGPAGTTPVLTAGHDWAAFRGMIAQSLQISASPGQAGWTGSLTFLGKDEIILGPNVTVANQGFAVDNWDCFTVPTTVPLVNTLQNVILVRVRESDSTLSGSPPGYGGAASPLCRRHDPLSANINVSNNGTGVGALRNLGNILVQQGTFTASVTLSVIYDGPSYHTGMLVDKAYELEIGLMDASFNAQLWRFPRCRLLSERPNPGKNQVVQTTLTFSAEAGGDGMTGTAQLTLETANTGKMIEVLRFYALP
ncbi:MAG TPA: phage tail tube protein [Ramlibacter sp.]|nr:phage tail tube protein [Ramlibacter sp.]